LCHLTHVKLACQQPKVMVISLLWSKKAWKSSNPEIPAADVEIELEYNIRKDPEE
jgi:hypothetical protein